MTSAAMKMRYSPEIAPECRNEILALNDRPGWIPPEITENWDTDPYSYQTEEELMPAGGLHGYLLNYFVEILRNALESRGLMLLADTFMLYRDSQGVKQRISPDLLLMPLRFPPPSAYNLDIEPPPSAVMEVTSPKSHLNDLKNKVLFYTRLGIPAYLVIDAVTPRAKLREQIALHLWRKIRGRMQQMQPDAEGYLELPEINIKIKAEGQRLIFADSATGEILHDAGEMKMIMLKERQRAETAEKKADMELRRAQLAEKKAEQAYKEALKQTAANLLKIGTDITIISQVTGLTEETIKQLLVKISSNADQL